MTTRLFQSKWVVLIGILALLGMTAAPILADGHHHHHGFRGPFGGRVFVPFQGYYRPYYTAPYPYYCPQPAAPHPPYYYGGGPGCRYYSPGWGLHVYVR